MRLVGLRMIWCKWTGVTIHLNIIPTDSNLLISSHLISASYSGVFTADYCHAYLLACFFFFQFGGRAQQRIWYFVSLSLQPYKHLTLCSEFMLFKNIYISSLLYLPFNFKPCLTFSIRY